MLLGRAVVLCCACVALYPTEPEIWFSAEHIWIEETNVDWVDWLDVDMTMTVAGYLDVTIVDHNYLWAVDLDGGLQFSVGARRGAPAGRRRRAPARARRRPPWVRGLSGGAAYERWDNTMSIVAR